MKFIRVRPDRHAIEAVEAEDAREAAPDLYQQGVDFGTYNGINPGRGGISYYVYEFGLYADNLAYFSLDRRLYAGDALFFRFDAAGETIDIGDWRPPEPLWLANKAEVEAAIARGKVVRPTASINGLVVWSWPSPQ